MSWQKVPTFGHVINFVRAILLFTLVKHSNTDRILTDWMIEVCLDNIILLWVVLTPIINSSMNYFCVENNCGISCPKKRWQQLHEGFWKYFGGSLRLREHLKFNKTAHIPKMQAIVQCALHFRTQRVIYKIPAMLAWFESMFPLLGILCAVVQDL